MSYVVTTVADGCILGAELSPSAGTQDLQAAYGVFAQEAMQLNPQYHWDATQAAWKKLFPGVTLFA